MFQLSGTKLFLLILIAASLGALWYLDTNYYHWGHTLPEPEKLLVENEPKPIKNNSFKTKEFLPTNEWQTIEKDQPIPPGLHVQIDLKTGEKKAKLIDGHDNIKTNDLSILASNLSENLEIPKHIDVKNFKTYEQLKDDLKQLNMTVKSEIEIMDDLSAKFKEQMKLFEDSDKNIRNILFDLEYLLHQVDTAEVFIKNKGIESIIIPCINSNSTFMKAQGALLLGSAASNNQKVQISALQAGVIPILLDHLSNEYAFLVQKNCFFALASITRRFPAAQKELKVSQLLEDLVIEIEDAQLTLREETNEQLSSEAKERVRQYSELHMVDKLVENGWCEILGNEFISLSNPLPTNQDSHDMIEASGKSLLALSKSCKAKLQGNKQLFKSLYILEIHYKKLFQKDKYFNTLFQLMNELTNTYDPVLE
ncbi:Hypothetical protein CINCED_3A008175 [Cinara cedri]|uniref:Nucleotide exchange factor SIL1 n=1 Tax=Cinara cedri TaxID=506608 RepID=A0A5E4MPE3_9HEMI|nr:Hypothetical protein CINCED_3A008175 [Cinara cedri]